MVFPAQDGRTQLTKLVVEVRCFLLHRGKKENFMIATRSKLFSDVTAEQAGVMGFLHYLEDLSSVNAFAAASQHEKLMVAIPSYLFTEYASSPRVSLNVSFPRALMASIIDLVFSHNFQCNL
jgi:hypothetical protein